jgi:hypothetical protein
MNIDLASVTQAQAVVLVEGISDKAALEALAERRGQMLGSGGICVVAMGGAANASRFLDLLGPHGIGARVAGLCDAGAEGFFRRALERAGLGSSVSRAGMEVLGFYVCTAHLEDELIRAVGHAVVEQIIQAQGELRSFRTFQKQPAQQRRSSGEQLHRFMGTDPAGRGNTLAFWQARLISTGFPGHLTACSPTCDQFSNSDAPRTQDRDS